MKPIKLKIKGLNSFIDCQEIDFKKLTDRGFFGIFGPTGSGKSTILDGITLALYGEVARKSSNFMNTNCDSLNVSFEFQISGQEVKRYKVEREFRRENKTGNIRSKSAKITDITEGNEEILEEGAKPVTSKCEEIIGLQIEDFMRTVVLPQGKFSEFLKLEGKERRNMLERLFNLQKYGDELSFKLTNKIREEKQKASVLEGQLKGYENINEEVLEEKNKALSEVKKQRDNCELELNAAEDEFNKGKELWDIQNELKEQLSKQKRLKENEERINEIQRKVALGESALKIKPYIEGFENTLFQLETVGKKLSILTKKIEDINVSRQKFEDELNNVKDKKDKELPELKVKEQKVMDAIEEKAALTTLLEEKKLLEHNIINLERELQNINNKILENESSISNISSSISDSEAKVEALKIPEEYKKKINEGIVILTRYEGIIKQRNNLSNSMKSTLGNIEEAKAKSEDLSKGLKIKEGLLHNNNEALEKLIDACPGDQNTLLDLQEKLAVVRDKWNKYKEYNNALDKSGTIIDELKASLDERIKEKTCLEQEISEINVQVEKIQIENLAHTLRVALAEGEPCPVCGSKEHHVEDIKPVDLSNLEQLKMDLSEKKEKEKLLTAEIIKAQTGVSKEEENIKYNREKIKELGEDFKLTPVDNIQNEFVKLRDSINKFNSSKEALENRMKLLTKENNGLEIEYNKELTMLSQNEAQLLKLKEEFKGVEEEVEKTDRELGALKSELSVEDLKSKRDEIIKKEKEKTVLENLLKSLRDNLKTTLSQKERLNSESGVLREKLSEKKTTLIEKNKNIEEKQNAINSKVGDVVDLDELKKEISLSIERIEEEYAAAEKRRNEIEKEYNECNSNIISLQSNLYSLKERSIKDKESLEKALSEEGIKDIDEVKKSFMPKVEIDKFKSEIEKYKDSLAKISGSIESLRAKVGNRSLSEEEWQQIQNIKNEKTRILKEFEEAKIKLEEEVKTISGKLIELKELLKNKQELDHKLSLLDDLEKLFKGKRFVEFVAANQLKYISFEASKWLKEITGGNYGLEVDENGKFLIRDNKNGGSTRDASTLSGGETFVASLALALALSSQIQLKGTAPLELFFLDEGFGTLDDNLLEVVMDSLEKIHNERLSIGIISHVEAIKNRVPVKLIVTPAEAGMGGSKVRFERS